MLYICTHTFFWLQSALTEGFPRRKFDWSITSSWISDALWIISDIIATCRCDGRRPLDAANAEDKQEKPKREYSVSYGWHRFRVHAYMYIYTRIGRLRDAELRKAPRRNYAPVTHSIIYGQIRVYWRVSCLCIARVSSLPPHFFLFFIKCIFFRVIYWTTKLRCRFTTMIMLLRKLIWLCQCK